MPMELHDERGCRTRDTVEPAEAAAGSRLRRDGPPHVVNEADATGDERLQWERPWPLAGSRHIAVDATMEPCMGLMLSVPVQRRCLPILRLATGKISVALILRGKTQVERLTEVGAPTASVPASFIIRTPLRDGTAPRFVLQAASPEAASRWVDRLHPWTVSWIDLLQADQGLTDAASYFARAGATSTGTATSPATSPSLPAASQEHPARGNVASAAASALNILSTAIDAIAVCVKATGHAINALGLVRAGEAIPVAGPIVLCLHALCKVFATASAERGAGAKVLADAQVNATLCIAALSVSAALPNRSGAGSYVAKCLEKLLMAIEEDVGELLHFQLCGRLWTLLLRGGTGIPTRVKTHLSELRPMLHLVLTYFPIDELRQAQNTAAMPSSAWVSGTDSHLAGGFSPQAPMGVVPTVSSADEGAGRGRPLSTAEPDSLEDATLGSLSGLDGSEIRTVHRDPWQPSSGTMPSNWEHPSPDVSVRIPTALDSASLLADPASLITSISPSDGPFSPRRTEFSPTGAGEVSSTDVVPNGSTDEYGFALFRPAWLTEKPAVATMPAGMGQPTSPTATLESSCEESEARETSEVAPILHAQEDRTLYQLFYEAAALGNLSAMANLGVCFQQGIGVAPSLAAAMDLLAVAAHAGDSVARRKLRLALPELEQATYMTEDQYLLLYAAAAHNGVGVIQQRSLLGLPAVMPSPPPPAASAGTRPTP